MMKRGIECSQVVVEKAAKAIRRNNEKAQKWQRSRNTTCACLCYHQVFSKGDISHHHLHYFYFYFSSASSNSFKLIRDRDLRRFSLSFETSFKNKILMELTLQIRQSLRRIIMF